MVERCHPCRIGSPPVFCLCDDIDFADIELCVEHGVSIIECGCDEPPTAPDAGMGNELPG